MIDLIENIKKGRWVIDDIAPIFFKKIPKSHTDKSICVYNFYNYKEKISGPKGLEAKIRNKLKNNDLSVEDFSYKLSPESLGLQEYIQLTSLINKHFSDICVLSEINFQGASHPHFWGKIFINKNLLSNNRSLTNCLVHEMAHQELFLLNLIDRLTIEKFDSNLVYAPYQGIKRPPIGRLHSCHALFRMLQYRFCENYSELHEKLRENIKNIYPYEVTKFTKELINEVYIPFCRTNTYE